MRIKAFAGGIFSLLTFLNGLCLADVLSISGTDSPTNGSHYEASGGCIPYSYSWAISKGIINASGFVTVSGQCGTATITATDSCGTSASKTVRLPQGDWFTVHSYPTPSCGENSSDTIQKGSQLIYRCQGAGGTVLEVGTYGSCYGPVGTAIPMNCNKNIWTYGCVDDTSLTQFGTVCFMGNFSGYSRTNVRWYMAIAADLEWRCEDQARTECVDNDHDGHYAINPNCPRSDDTDDNDPRVYPGAPEVCFDGKDNNGNGLVDEGCFGNTNLNTCTE
jgi:hypothetical protein